MLADAVLAEAYRMGRNRFQLIWSVFLVPVLFLLGGVAYHVVSKAKGDAAAAEVGLTGLTSTAPVNLAEALTFGANWSANFAVLVFMLIGAATLYAGDYRWETWRLISARNSRLNLILGKVGVAKLMAAAATLSFIVAAMIFYLAQALVYHRGISFSITGPQLGQAALIWLLSYIRVVQYGLIALLASVVTRSTMAALFAPWGLGFVQSVFGIPPVMMLLGLKPDGWPAALLRPGHDYDALKAAVAQSPTVGQPSVAAALTGLAIWIVVPLVLAIVLFQRQDLAKE